MSVLRATIKRRYFDAILDGTKTVEYREVKPYWSRRIEGRNVSILCLTAGYSKKSPRLIVGVDRIVKMPPPPTVKGLGKEVYAFHLGKADLV